MAKRRNHFENLPVILKKSVTKKEDARWFCSQKPVTLKKSVTKTPVMGTDTNKSPEYTQESVHSKQRIWRPKRENGRKRKLCVSVFLCINAYKEQ